MVHTAINSVSTCSFVCMAGLISCPTDLAAGLALSRLPPADDAGGVVDIKRRAAAAKERAHRAV